MIFYFNLFNFINIWMYIFDNIKLYILLIDLLIYFGYNHINLNKNNYIYESIIIIIIFILFYFILL